MARRRPLTDRTYKAKRRSVFRLETMADKKIPTRNLPVKPGQQLLSKQQMLDVIGNPAYSTVWEWMRADQFPRPIELGPSVSAPRHRVARQRDLRMAGQPTAAATRTTRISRQAQGCGSCHSRASGEAGEACAGEGGSPMTDEQVLEQIRELRGQNSIPAAAGSICTGRCRCAPPAGGKVRGKGHPAA